MMEIPSIHGWINGEYPLGNVIFQSKPERINDQTEQKLFWLYIEKKVVAHAIHEKNNYSIVEVPEQHLRYIHRVLNLFSLQSLPLKSWETKSISEAERVKIIEVAGPPPDHSRPIYFITVSKNNQHQIVYVGKTINQNARFSGGHRALTKLLNPIYDGQEKSIFFCSLYFGINPGFKTGSIDFIQDTHYRNSLISEVEAMLINSFTPELNENFTDPRRPPTITEIDLSIHNHSNENIHLPTQHITDEILRNGRYFLNSGY